MKKSDVIIVGAGAAGLMAAYTLVKAEKTVTILEARNRIGGRIHTLENTLFSGLVELGAEFVHGNLPVTLNLLKEAGIGNSNVNFEMWQYHNGKFEQSDAFVEGWDTFLKTVNSLQQDMPLKDFLQENFAGNSKMCTQIENYVAGYDTADILDASTFALRNEWNHEDEDAQYRVNGGYGALMQYLADQSCNVGSTIVFNTAVKRVLWENDKIEVVAANGFKYYAHKVIIALPLGVLQAQEDIEGAIHFEPALPKHKEALHNIGFGSVIKILLEFKSVFWESDGITKLTGANLSTMGFLFAYEDIPTFWTQAPAHSPLLTGWLGGLPAHDKRAASRETIMKLAIESLGNIFKIEPEALQNNLVAWEVANWTSEPYTRGSYAYDTIKSPEARRILRQPVEDTIYFAGEYLYDGPAMGTVEAALTSGKRVGDDIYNKIKMI